MNVKVKNATPLIVDGIKFQSKLEVRCYQLLKENNLGFVGHPEPFIIGTRIFTEFYYEPYSIKILDSIRPEFELYEVNHGLLCKVKPNKSNNKMPLIRSVKYNPDFVYEDDFKLIIIETKGYKNDVYPYKRKLLFRFLNNYQKEYDKKVYFFEPTNIGTTKQTIEIIKQILNRE